MRVRAVVVAVVAVASVGWPVLRQPQVDSFPLSTYPMFTRLRPRDTTIDLAVGSDATGADVRLDPSLVGGTIEVIHAVATVGRSIADGTAHRLCTEIATRVSEAGRDDVVAVAITTDRYDVVDRLVRGGSPIQRTVHAWCEVRP